LSRANAYHPARLAVNLPGPHLVARVLTRAIRFKAFGRKMVFAIQYRYPVAGLDPATHVFAITAHCCLKTWMAGSNPATGDFSGGSMIGPVRNLLR